MSAGGSKNFKLMLSLRSPFARRARLALSRVGLEYDPIELNVFEPTPDFLAANPLALVPVLWVPEAKTWLSDSSSILEYLHEAHGQAIWPADPVARVQVRQAATWAEGVMLATVNHYLESLRGGEKVSEEWLQEHTENVHRTLQRIYDGTPGGAPWFLDGKLTQAGWDLGVALEYIDLRMRNYPWRKPFARLELIMEACNKSPAFAATRPPQ